MTIQLYPAYKETADIIANSNNIFFSDNDLSEMLEEELQSDKYRFALMNLQSWLLNEHDINLIRSNNEVLGKGYKIATATESVSVTAARLHRRYYTTVGKHKKILGVVNRKELTHDVSETYDRHCMKNGLMRAFLSKTPLLKCLPDVRVRIDVPKLVTG